ncbi:MAG: SBBP repeat-containing protein [Anaerolineae bacterium]|nr:SBBP repeat-containing protein [Anaerolineae bacterium]
MRAHLLSRCFMLLVCLLLLVPSAGTALGAVSTISQAGVSSPADPARITHAYTHLPMRFEANHGQAGAQVSFLARGSGYTLYLTPDGALFSLGSHARPLVMTPVGGEAVFYCTGDDPLPGISNYFLGSDPDGWITGVPAYARVRCQAVYPGVDMVYHGDQGALRYDFIIAPGVDPARIRLRFDPVERLELDARGDLLLHLDGGIVRQAAPVTYQEIGGARVEVPSRFVLLDGELVGFEVGAYDSMLPLVIDPRLVYSTLLGGDQADSARGVAVGADGSMYVVGYTNGNFPTTPGAFDETYADNGYSDVFVARLNAAGDALIYSTYLGGGRPDYAYDVVVDADGNAYVTGYAGGGFPTTEGAYDRVIDGSIVWLPGDAFVTKLNPDGDGLVFSTFVGQRQADAGYGIALDTDGSVYITGYTQGDFPTTPGAFDETFNDDDDAFVAKLNADGSDLMYSTYLGGSYNDRGEDIAVDSSGSAYVTGMASEEDFPTTPGAYSQTHGPYYDAFATKLNTDGSDLVYSTFLGASWGRGIAVNSSGYATITGETDDDFVPTPGAYDETFNGTGSDVFVATLNADGSALQYGTFLGGAGFEYANDIALGDEGDVVLVGITQSADFPTTPGAYDRTYGADWDVFITSLDAGGTSLDYSTYLGHDGIEQGFGITLDGDGAIYAVGYTASTGFPTTPNAYDQVFDGTYNEAWLVKFVPDSIPAQAGCYPFSGGIVVCTAD